MALLVSFSFQTSHKATDFYDVDSDYDYAPNWPTLSPNLSHMKKNFSRAKFRLNGTSRNYPMSRSIQSMVTV